MSAEPLTVLYDGWPVARQPNSPAALHTLALLAHLPEGVQPVVALPAEAPDWFPSGVESVLRFTPETPRNRLIWEQYSLPKLSGELGTQLIHLSTSHAPFFSKTPVLLSPTDFESQPPSPGGFLARLREALGRGAMSRVSALLWPEDLPTPEINASVVQLPPLVHPDFSSGGAEGPSLPEGVDLPYAYVLYHGAADPQVLQKVLRVWSWTIAPLGDSTPLVFLGLGASAQEWLGDFFERHNLDIAVRFLPPVSPEGMAHLYRKCTAVLHLGSISPWTGPVRHALACGRPVVAPESDLADALVGPAAYLVPGDDPRAMGAALLTVIVNRDVAKRFSQAARQRSAPWGTSAFGEALVEAYRSLQSRG